MFLDPIKNCVPQRSALLKAVNLEALLYMENLVIYISLPRLLLVNWPSPSSLVAWFFLRLEVDILALKQINHLLPNFCFTTCIACLVTSRVSFITSSVWAKDRNQLWWGWIRIPKRQHSELKVMPLGLWNGSSPWKGGIISEGFFNVVYVILKRDVLNHYSSTIQPLLRSWGTGI